VRGYLGERLAAFKVPRYVSLTDKPLPRNAMQKILKKEVRAAWLASNSDTRA
jgi:acyl-coenzyme A synthetase/AMP-(fatty) acid ligase